MAHPRWSTASLLLTILLLAGCDDARRRLDPDERADADALSETDVRVPPGDGAVLDAAALDAAALDAAVLDAAVPDARAPDGALPDAGDPDIGFPSDVGALDAASPDMGPPDQGFVLSDAGFVPDTDVPDADRPDAEPPDMEQPDADQPDADLPDAEQPDAELPDAVVIAEGFLEGEAGAIDGVTPTVVRVGEVEAEVEPDGRYRLGPLPPGEVEVVVEAEGHQAETFTAEVPEMGAAQVEAVVLFRGRRVTPDLVDRLFFSTDDAWLGWSMADTLWASPLAEPAPRLLVDQDYEVYLGFEPGNQHMTIRRRTEAGVAGDIQLIPLAGGDPITLFRRAQPWVRWDGGRALAMVDTAGGLSRLVSTVPGEPPIELGLRVPWLLVSQLLDDRAAWAQGRPVVGDPEAAPEVFDIVIAGVDGAGRQVISPAGGGSGSRLLTTTAGRRGLLWVSPEGDLWRWTGEGAAVRIAGGVLTSPRPAGLGVSQVLYWRGGEAANAGDYLFFDGMGERVLAREIRRGSTRTVGRTLYGLSPAADALVIGSLDMPPAVEALRAEAVSFTTVGTGAVIIADGVAWTHSPDQMRPVRRGPAPVTRLRTAAVGVTGWDAETDSVWWLPGPGDDGQPTLLARGAPSDMRLRLIGQPALLTADAMGVIRKALPPGAAPDVRFEAPADTLVTVDADRVLGYVDEGLLHQFDPATGRAIRWADGVVDARVSVRRRYAIYRCERGVFVVPLAR